MKGFYGRNYGRYFVETVAFPAQSISGLKADASRHRVDDRMFEIDEPLCYKSELERQAVKRLPSFS